MPLALFDTEIFAPLLLDDSGTITRVGRGWPSIFDVDVEELLERQLADLVRADDVPVVRKALARLQAGAPSAIIRVHTDLGRRSRRLRFRLQPFDGLVLAVAEDVTERKAVAARSTTLARLGDQVHDAWFVHDMEGRIRDANPWALESLGYTLEELLELHIAEIERTIKPGRLDGVWNRMEVGRPVTVEGIHRRKNGTEFPVECRLALFETEDEVLMLAVVRDISKRKIAQQKMEELNEELQEANQKLGYARDRLAEEVTARTNDLRQALVQLETTFEHLVDGIATISCQGQVAMVNPAFLSLFGMADPTGKEADEALPMAVCELIREALQFDEHRSMELSLPGDRIGVGVASPLGGSSLDGGECDGVVLMVRDVTLEKEIDRMKTDFIATVSHELRTPLTSVLGFAKLTSQRLETKIFPHIPTDDTRAQRAVEQVRGNVEIILSEGERLTALINDVLDISKMESGRMEWHMGSVLPGDLVRRAAAATSALFEGGSVELVIDVADELPRITGDEDRLMQVLINLISNATKFTRTGQVRVIAEADADHVRFRVTDTGEGIDPALHESIFEKFRQVGDTLTNKPKGTGLGLPICRQIVNAHQGRISVASKIGSGSTFTVELPVREPTDEANEVPQRTIHDLEKLVRRIESQVPMAIEHLIPDVLVVDDDPSLRELLRQQLTDRGYSVRLAADGREAMAQVRAKRPDLVILDVMMPEISGFDVAAMLKADPTTAAIPIMILSIVQDKQRGLRLGVDRYLTKPASAEALLSNVHDLLVQVRSPRRVLVVDQSTTATSDVVKLLETKGFHVVGTCTGQEALEEARRSKPDLILVDTVVDASEELIRTIKFERGLEHVVVVQLSEQGGVPSHG